MAPSALLETVERPDIRKISFGDLADPTVQAVVVRLIRSAGPHPHEIPDHELIHRLSTGQLEAYWVLTEQGQQCGAISFEIGVLPENMRRCLYVVSAAVVPHMSEAGWIRLFEFGKAIALARQCAFIQFDCTPDHRRMIEIGECFGAARGTGRVLGGHETVRFTFEVTNHG